MSEAQRDYRVGLGYDIHRLAEGRRLILAGVSIPYSKGLSGHSDADVVLHAVTDAVLGAAALPDIGELFPDADSAYKDADSAALLSLAMTRVRQKGFAAQNADVVVHAEAPKLSAYKTEMARSLAAMLDVTQGQVSIKAKTNEGLGPIGHGEAIACTAVVLLVCSQAAEQSEHGAEAT